MKDNLIKSIKQAVCIFFIALFFGFVVNLLHPRQVKITSKRPSLQFAPDTVRAQVLPAVSVTANGTAKNDSTADPAEPLLITTAQVLQLKESDLAVLLDARAPDEFLKSHLPGAKNIPWNSIAAYQTQIDSLPHDKWLICYCDSPPCDQAELLAHELLIAGYQLVAVYFDGLNGWKSSGYEIGGREARRDEK